jgi:hypothetical protein
MKGLSIAITVVATLAAPVAALADELEPAAPLTGQKSDVAPDVEFTLLPNWQVGDSYRVEQIKQKTQIRRGVQAPAMTARSVSQVRVIEKTDSGYLLVSTVKLAEVTGGKNAPPEAVKTATAMAKLVIGKSMEIVTNEAGFPVALRNADEVTVLVREALDQVVQSVSSDPDEQERVRQAMNQIATPQVIEALALKDVQVFYGLLGSRFGGGLASVYATELPFPLTQAPIAATTHTLLRRVETKKGLLHVAIQTVPDGDAMKAAVVDWMRGMLEAQGKPMPQEGDLPTFEMQDTADYIFDLNRSLPTQVSWERYVKLGSDYLRLERSNFRLLPPG